MRRNREIRASSGRGVSGRLVGGAGGYTLVEIMLVVTVGAILFGLAAISARSAIPQLRANSALQNVKMQIMLARERAQSERRTLEVSFIDPNRVRTRRLDVNGNWESVNDITLEGGVEFRLFATLPDTPDAFGNQSAVTLDGGGRDVFCRADGMFVDSAGVPTNGTIFLGRQTEPASARALTLFGATGRLTSYHWTAEGWSR